MWIILDKYLNYHPLQDEEGHTKFFPSKEEAHEEGAEFCQDYMIVDIDG